MDVEWNKSKKVVTTYGSWDTIIQRSGHVVVSKMAPDVRAWDDGSNKVWLIEDGVWSHAAPTPERESCCTECGFLRQTVGENVELLDMMVERRLPLHGSTRRGTTSESCTRRVLRARKHPFRPSWLPGRLVRSRDEWRRAKRQCKPTQTTRAHVGPVQKTHS